VADPGLISISRANSSVSSDLRVLVESMEEFQDLEEAGIVVDGRHIQVEINNFNMNMVYY